MIGLEVALHMSSKDEEIQNLKKALMILVETNPDWSLNVYDTEDEDLIQNLYNKIISGEIICRKS